MKETGANGLADVLLHAIAQSPSIVLVTDSRGDIEYANSAFYRVTGYACKEVLGQNARVLKSGQMRPAFYADLWAELVAGGDWHGEFHNRKKHGELFWESAVISAIRNSEGVVEHYLKVAEDITIRELLKGELEASQQRFERVITAMRGFMFTVFFDDGKPARTVYHPGSRNITGYTTDEYRSNPSLWFSMIVAEDRALVTTQVQRVEADKQTSTIEHRIRHKNGSIRWVRNISVPRLDPRQQLLSYDGLITDITDRKAVEIHRDQLLEQTQHLAVRDALTGLYSRRVLQDELNRAWQLGDRRGLPLGLMMLDLDLFKVLNDTYGHQVGDQVLVEAARLIRATARASDVVVRYGGDEIVIIMPLAGLEEARQVGQRMLDAFRQHCFCAGNYDLGQMISIGVASGAGSAQPVEEILRRADQALYRAKRLGRNRLCHAEPGVESPFVVPKDQTHSRVIPHGKVFPHSTP